MACQATVNDFLLLHSIGLKSNIDLIEYPLRINGTDILYSLFGKDLLDTQIYSLEKMKMSLKNITRNSKHNHPISTLKTLLKMQDVVNRQKETSSFRRFLNRGFLGILIISMIILAGYGCWKLKPWTKCVRSTRAPKDKSNNLEMERSNEPLYDDMINP